MGRCNVHSSCKIRCSGIRSCSARLAAVIQENNCMTERIASGLNSRATAMTLRRRPAAVKASSAAYSLENRV